MYPAILSDSGEMRRISYQTVMRVECLSVDPENSGTHLVRMTLSCGHVIEFPGLTNASIWVGVLRVCPGCSSDNWGVVIADKPKEGDVQ